MGNVSSTLPPSDLRYFGTILTFRPTHLPFYKNCWSDNLEHLTYNFFMEIEDPKIVREYLGFIAKDELALVDFH